VKVTTDLPDRAQADANSRIRREMLPPDARPALTVVVAHTLESQWLLEIEAIAAR
jgi:2-iminobutanoate/2-iminopropanoate deaminase